MEWGAVLPMLMGDLGLGESERFVMLVFVFLSGADRHENAGSRITTPYATTSSGPFLTYPLRLGVGYRIYCNTMRTLHELGTGRYTDDEIRGSGRRSGRRSGRT